MGFVDVFHGRVVVYGAAGAGFVVVKMRGGDLVCEFRRGIAGEIERRGVVELVDPGAVGWVVGFIRENLYGGVAGDL